MSHAAYVFDAYGTLFDVHAAVRRHAQEIGPTGKLSPNSGAPSSSNIPGCAR